jgi:hypothetical protein
LSPKKKDAERLIERLICLTCKRVSTCTTRRIEKTLKRNRESWGS